MKYILITNQTMTDKFEPKFNMESKEAPGAELMTVVVQEAYSKEILMTAFATREAVEKTLTGGKATFYSRTKKRLWTKGEDSGNKLIIKDVFVDCDQDALLYVVELKGEGACHEKNDEGVPRKSCFFRKIEGQDKLTDAELPKDRLTELARLIEDRQKEMPAGSSSTEAFIKGTEWMLLKMLEEAGEVSTAVVKKQGREQLILEAGQLIYRLLLILTDQRVKIEEVLGKI
jgi:phosphoribosyl-ATP pyrophosphohydrolase